MGHGRSDTAMACIDVIQDKSELDESFRPRNPQSLCSNQGSSQKSEQDPDGERENEKNYQW